MARKRKEVEPSVVEMADVEVAPDAQLEELIEEASISVEEVVEPEMVPTKWVVLEEARVSLFGHITTLPEGTKLSLAAYGESAIRRIIQQGVKLAPIG